MHIEISNSFWREDPTRFRARFNRCQQLLRFVARHVIGHEDGVNEAVANCRLKASRSGLEFANEGGFRSWLVRVLIDEALAIAREQGPRRESSREHRSLEHGA